MKKLINIWTLIYKEKGCTPLTFSFTSKKDAILSEKMVLESDGDEIIDEHGNIEGHIELEWCYLLEGTLIEPSDI